jgi:hypothetical protein
MRRINLNGQVLLADDHFALYFDYDAEAVKAVKRLPGAKWDRPSLATPHYRHRRSPNLCNAMGLLGPPRCRHS